MAARAQVKIRTDADADRAVSDDPLLDQFTTYEPSFKGGVNVAAGAIENAGGNGAEVIDRTRAGKPRKVVIRTDSDATTARLRQPLVRVVLPVRLVAGRRSHRAGDTDHSGFFVEVVTAPGAAAGRTSRSSRSTTTPPTRARRSATTRRRRSSRRCRAR